MMEKDRKTSRNHRRTRAFCLAECLEPRRLLSTFTVTNNTDNTTTAPAGSLRWAINSANNAAGVDTVAFNLPAGQRTIRPLGELPALWDPTILDGTTQPGFAGSPLVQIDGSSAGNATGLKIFGGDTVKGVSITNFAYSGIDILLRSGLGANTITGNWIGLDLSGAAAGNTANGIYVGTPNNVIGGTTASERNVISGSKGANGIFIHGTTAGGNTIQGNYIGTDPTGTAARANFHNGVGTQYSPNNRIINNVISGNTDDGIILIGAGSSGNVVQGNIVGLNAAGTTALPNTLYGIEIQTDNNTIGGTTAAQRNIFSANLQTGIVLYTSGATANLIQGNYIGTDITGNLDRGNKFQGIALSNSPGNTIKGNLISGNDAEGVGIFPANNNIVQGNTIGWSASGAAMLNATWGVVMVGGATGNTIGGTGAGQGNYINGNHPSGAVYNSGTNTVTGNVATAPTGTSVPGAFTFGASTYTAAEAGGTVTITVNRTAGTNIAAAVNYATGTGTATAGSDYTAASGTLNFAAGQTSATFTIALINDTLVEGNETVPLSLSSPTAGATVGSPSTSTLTITSEDVAAVDTIPPTVTSAQFVYDANPQKLLIGFSEDVSATLSAADFYIINSQTFQSISPTSVTFDKASNTATVTFSGTLANAVYKCNLFGDGVTDAAGNKLDGNNDGVANGTFVYNFFQLAGDADRDGGVGLSDLLTLSNNYGGTGGVAQGDFDHDGHIGLNDLLILANNYGTALTLPAASPAAAPAPAPAMVIALMPPSRNPKAVPGVKPVAIAPPAKTAAAKKRSLFSDESI